MRALYRSPPQVFHTGSSIALHIGRIEYGYTLGPSDHTRHSPDSKLLLFLLRLPHRIGAEMVPAQHNQSEKEGFQNQCCRNRHQHRPFLDGKQEG
jgi:hypothetical protein